MVEHFQASLLIMTAQCIIWNRTLPYFSPFHTDTFCPFFFLNLKGKSLLKREHVFSYQVNCQQIQAILGSNK